MNNSEENPFLQDFKHIDLESPPPGLDLKQWICHIDKRPCTVDGRWSGCTHTDDYVDFETANDSEYEIGFCFTENDKLVGIDLDHCIRDGELLPWAKTVCDGFHGTYTEISRGGDGIHIYALGEIPEGYRCKSPVFDDGSSIEIYDRGRYFTFTGRRLSPAEEVNQQQHVIDWVCEHYIPKDKPEPTAQIAAQPVDTPKLSKRMQAYADGCEGVVDGDRDNTCFALAGHLFSFPGAQFRDVLRLCREFSARCTPPFPEGQCLKCVESAAKGNGTPPAAKTQQATQPVKTIDIDAKFGLTAEFLEKFDMWPGHPNEYDLKKAMVEGSSAVIHHEGFRSKIHTFEKPDEENGATEKYAKWTTSILPLVRSVTERVTTYPNMKPVIIDGLFRKREVFNLVAAPKVGKSWLSMQMAVSVALGLDFIGLPTNQQNVFVLDNELHPETSVSRLNMMINQLGINPADLNGRLVVDNIRGDLHSLDELEDYFAHLGSEYGLIICDALYRLLPKGVSENDNADIARLYNMLDKYAEGADAAICCIHHTSKGDQSGKSTTDVGSGAGSQSRAADTHLTLLPHEIDDCAVLNGVVRSFPGFRPMTLKREFPLWVEKPGVPPEVKKPEGVKKEDLKKKWDTDEEVFQILKGMSGPQTAKAIYDNKGDSKIGRTKINAALKTVPEIYSSKEVINGREREVFFIPDHIKAYPTIADYRSSLSDLEC